MNKLRKFTITFGVITLVSLILSFVGVVLLNLLSPSFKDSTTVYISFLETLFDGSFLSNSDILAYVSLGVLALLVLFSLIWLIMLLIKKKWLVFLYFLLCLAVGVLFSYTLFLFADVLVLNNRYFYFKEAVTLAESGDLLAILLSVISLFFISITVCFVITFGILSIVLAYKQKKEIKEDDKSKLEENSLSENNELKSAVNEEIKEEEKEIFDSETEKPVKEERILLVRAKRVEKAKKEQLKKVEHVKVEVSKNVKEEEEIMNKKVEAKKSSKVYHVSHHPTEDKWQVKLAKGEKAIKLFDTQLEAIQYAREVSKSQGGSIRLHSVNGRIRKI